MNFYTGIGSRATPHKVMMRMTKIAHERARADTHFAWTLRSGAAEGADEAFEAGAKGTRKEIWLPWPRFRGHASTLLPSPAAFELAAAVHPNWAACSEAARKLHARNCHVVLGVDLKTPSLELICWTPGGELVGGTATALRLAMTWGIRITNFGSRT